jgi:hypothetical protein
MKFVFNTSLCEEVKNFINAGAGSYPIASGVLHVHKENGKNYIAYEKNGGGDWHIVINAMGWPIESITE